MTKYLSKIIEVFCIGNNGCVALLENPRKIEDNSNLKKDDEIELIYKDQKRKARIKKIEKSIDKEGVQPFFSVLLQEGITKKDLAIGTEVWTDEKNFR